jgi:hypothetical protein
VTEQELERGARRRQRPLKVIDETEIRLQLDRGLFARLRGGR